jgi:hypothetical protein
MSKIEMPYAAWEAMFISTYYAGKGVYIGVDWVNRWLGPVAIRPNSEWEDILILVKEVLDEA